MAGSWSVSFLFCLFLVLGIALGWPPSWSVFGPVVGLGFGLAGGGGGRVSLGGGGDLVQGLDLTRQKKFDGM